MKLLFEAKLEEAVQYTVVFPENNIPYAMNWLKLTNNAREYHESFLKIENNAGRCVFVTCTKESAENVKDYLEWLGDVIEEQKVYVCRPQGRFTDKVEDHLWSIVQREETEIVFLAPEELY